MTNPNTAYSCCVVVDEAHHADLEVVWCARGKSELPGYSFTAPLSADGTAPATHYGCNDQTNAAEAAIYAALPTSGGTIPPDVASVDWTEWGITEARAIAACAATKVSVATGISGGSNFAALIAQPDILLVEVNVGGGLG